MLIIMKDFTVFLLLLIIIWNIIHKLHLKQKLETMYELLDKVVHMLNDNNIPYHLEAGTLLGCIRENGLMSKDTDVDVTIHLTMWENLKEIDIAKYGLIKKRCRGNSYSPCGWPNGHIYSVRLPYTLMYCDIYANPAFPKLTEYKLKEKVYKIPVEPELYLTQLYGNWKVPSGYHAKWPGLFYDDTRIKSSEYSKNWDLNYEIFSCTRLTEEETQEYDYYC
jgi:hypothetical protein